MPSSTSLGDPPATIAADARTMLVIDLPTARRGLFQADELALVSRHPLGLWQRRCALPAVTGLVYPRPRGEAKLPASSPRPAHRQAATDDFQGLRAYAPGDEVPERNIFYRLAKRFWFNDFGVYEGHDHSKSAAPALMSSSALMLAVKPLAMITFIAAP